MNKGVDPDLIDAARRASDIINEIRHSNDFISIRRKWIAIRLEDGGYDGVLYDSKRDAVKHQKNEFLCAYVSFRSLGHGASWFDMAKFLQFNRDAYKAGFRLPDPEDAKGGRELAMTTLQNDKYENILARAVRLRITND